MIPLAVESDWVARRATLFLVMGVAVAAGVATNLPWQLDDYDQAKQAFTSLEMIGQGHWLFQHTPNGWTATKPPLVGWISALLFALTRSWDFAWRAPSWLAAGGLFFAVHRCARRAYGDAAAVIALAAVSLNLFAPRLSTLVRTDMPLALLIFLIGAQIWRKIDRAKPWTPRDRVIASGLLTAAMLVKGPIVYAFLLPGIVAFQIWSRRHPAAEKTSAWCGAWPWLVALLVFVVWVALGIKTVPEFLEHVVVREFAGRFEGTHRAQPFYFYLPHFLHRFAPWSLVLIGFAWMARRWPAPTARHERASSVWLVCWSLGAIVAMSLVPSKRVDRIFPVIPPLALLMAALYAQLRDRSDSKQHARVVATVAVIFAGLFTTGYTMAKVIPALRARRDAFAIFAREVRADAAARGLRFDVVGGEDEGMLPYLRKLEFSEVPEAAAHWRGAAIDAVVIAEDQLPDFVREVPEADPTRAQWSEPAGNHHRRYAFLTRR